jgi:hypothetical protein
MTGQLLLAHGYRHVIARRLPGELLPHQLVVSPPSAEDRKVSSSAWHSSVASVKFVNNYTKWQ